MLRKFLIGALIAVLQAVALPGQAANAAFERVLAAPRAYHGGGRLDRRAIFGQDVT